MTTSFDRSFTLSGNKHWVDIIIDSFINGDSSLEEYLLFLFNQFGLLPLFFLPLVLFVPLIFDSLRLLQLLLYLSFLHFLKLVLYYLVEIYYLLGIFFVLLFHLHYYRIVGTNGLFWFPVIKPFFFVIITILNSRLIFAWRCKEVYLVSWPEMLFYHLLVLLLDKI